MTIKFHAGDKITGLSTDAKPMFVTENSIFYETNTKKVYDFISGSWVENDVELSEMADGTAGKLLGYNESTGVVEEQDAPTGTEFQVITTATTTTPTKQTGVAEIRIDATSVTSGTIDLNIDGVSTNIASGGTYDELVNPSTSLSLVSNISKYDFSNIATTKLAFVDSFDCTAYDDQPKGIFIGDGGAKMYVCGEDHGGIDEYDLSTNNDVSTASHNQFKDTGSYPSDPSGISFKPDGTKMIISEVSNAKIHEYNLSTAWDISTASRQYTTGNFYGQGGGICTSMFIKPDGTKMYLTEVNANVIHQYSLSTAWDLSTVSYDNKSFNQGQDTKLRGLTLDPSGTILLYTGETGRAFYMARCSTAWDISTASYIGYAIGTFWEPHGIVYGTDGNTIFLVDGNGDKINEFSINNYQVHGAGAYLGVEDNTPYGIHIGDSGTKMYVLGRQNNKVFQYTLSSAYDVTTASYASKESPSVVAQVAIPYDIELSTDGTKLYVLDNTTDDVFQYTLSTAWDISTASYASKSISMTSEDTSPTAITMAGAGTKMYMAGASGKIYQYTLSTAWDVSTASYDTKSFNHTSQTTHNVSCFMEEDGLTFIIADSQNYMYKYTLSTAYDISTATYTNTSTQMSTYVSISNISGITCVQNGTKIIYCGGGGDDFVYQADVTGSFSGTALAKIA